MQQPPQPRQRQPENENLTPLRNGQGQLRIMPKISIIVPIYNVEDYLEQCLDSILSQPLRDLEVICVNDGSPDGCLAILKEYAQHDKRVVIIDQANQGASAARNNGLAAATGEYTLFVDPDDWLVIDSLPPLYEKASRTSADLIFFNYSSVNEKTGRRTANKNRAAVLRAHAGATFTPEYLAEAVFDLSAPIWSILYKTDFIRKNKLRFSNLRLSEGFLFYLRAFFAAETVLCLEEKVYIHRVGMQSSATKNIGKSFNDLFNAFYESEEFLKKNHLYKRIQIAFLQSRINLIANWVSRVGPRKHLEYRKTARAFRRYIKTNYDADVIKELHFPSIFHKITVKMVCKVFIKNVLTHIKRIFKIKKGVEKSRKIPTLQYRQNQFGCLIISRNFFKLKDKGFVNRYLSMFKNIPDYFAVKFSPALPLYQEHLERLNASNEICWRYTRRFGSIQKTTVYHDANGELRFKREILNEKGFIETADLIVYAEPERGLIQGAVLQKYLRAIKNRETLMHELKKFIDFVFTRFQLENSPLLDPVAFDAGPHNCILTKDGDYVLFDLEFKFKGGLDKSYALWRIVYHTIQKTFSPFSVYEDLCALYGVEPNWDHWERIDSINHEGLWAEPSATEQKIIFDRYFLKKKDVDSYLQEVGCAQ